MQGQLHELQPGPQPEGGCGDADAGQGRQGKGHVAGPSVEKSRPETWNFKAQHQFLAVPTFSHPDWFLRSRASAPRARSGSGPEAPRPRRFLFLKDSDKQLEDMPARQDWGHRSASLGFLRTK